MQYRKEIDGLRAFAVISVIFFHAGFEIFSGGFVGVDVFFVVSGYLITSIILREKSAEKFTLTNFYERRARRILPALFVIMLGCIPFAFALMEPAELDAFGQSLAATSIFSSNIFFWQEAGYFGGRVEFKPLLHTWSLAVEEQYYLLFPLFILTAWRFGKKRIVWTLIFIATASLLLAEWGSINKPIATFYLLPTRGWEILIGVFAAFYLENKTTENPRAIDEIGSAAGFILITYAVYAYSEITPFPGFFALVPTVGTLLIILFANPSTTVAKILRIKPVVHVGLVSYSFYLWHQPLFAFARVKNIDVTPAKAILLICFSYVFAYLSWRFVETPFRNRKGRFSRNAIAGMSALFVFLISGVGVFLHSTSGMLDSYLAGLPAAKKELYTYYASYSEKASIDQRYKECFLTELEVGQNFKPSCFSTKNNLLIWGDSHAAALSVGFNKNGVAYSQLTNGACAPVREKCSDFYLYSLDIIKQTQPKKIFLHANWSLLGDSVARNIGATLDDIATVSPASTIYIVGGVPRWEPSLPSIVIKLDMKVFNEDLYIFNGSLPKIAIYDDLLRHTKTATDFRFVSLTKHLCIETKCRFKSAPYSDELIAWDYGHLTEGGSQYVYQEIFKNVH